MPEIISSLSNTINPLTIMQFLRNALIDISSPLINTEKIINPQEWQILKEIAGIMLNQAEYIESVIINEERDLDRNEINNIIEEINLIGKIQFDEINETKISKFSEKIQDIINHSLNNSLNIITQKLGLLLDIQDPNIDPKIIETIKIDKPEFYKIIISLFYAGASTILSREFLIQEENSNNIISGSGISGISGINRSQILEALNRGIKETSEQLITYKGKLQNENIFLNSFFKKICPALDSRFGNPVEIIISPQLEKTFIKTNKYTIMNLLLNMCGNAKKHGGADKLKIEVTLKEKFVKFVVSDNGKGFDEKKYGEIYKYGFSGENSTGIGLAYAPERLKHSGASIKHNGHDGIDGGAKFEMLIPVSEPSKTCLLYLEHSIN